MGKHSTHKANEPVGRDQYLEKHLIVNIIGFVQFISLMACKRVWVIQYESYPYKKDSIGCI